MRIKALKKLIGAALLIIFAAAAFMGAGEDTLIKNLVSQRIDVMNGYFAGKTTLYEATEALKSAESGSLLKEDTQALQEYFRTDIEAVRRYAIEDVEISYQDEELICAVVTIEWIIEAMPEIILEKDEASGERVLLGEEHPQERLTAYYSTIVQKQDDGYRLVQFF